MTTANHRILIVDDNRAIHEDFRKILNTGTLHSPELDATEEALFGSPAVDSRKQNFTIDSAFQGHDGLDKVRQSLHAGSPYALAFVDVRMPPGWDGIETTARMWEVDPDLQIVICTAYSDYSWDEMTAKLDCSDRLVILKKPFDNVEALQLANTLSAKWNLQRKARHRVSDLEEMVRQRTEDLHKNHERLAIISRASNDAIWDWDIIADQLWWNEGFEVLFGYSSVDLDPGVKRWSNCVHPDDLERVMSTLEAGLTGRQQSWADEYRFRCHNGKYAIVAARGHIMRDDLGKAVRLVGALQDVTDRRRAENERRMLEIQLRQAQKLESIGQLAAGVAHEINTPMQFIGDNTRFVRDAFVDLQNIFSATDRVLALGPADARLVAAMAELVAARQVADLNYLALEIPKAIEQTIDGIERVTKIVRAMKEFSHPGADHKTLVDVNKAIESTLIVCRNEWKYLADLVMHFDAALPMVPVLPGEFNQVILNIIINGAHAIAERIGGGSTEKGTITVSTRCLEGAVEIRLRDTGGGIPEKIRERVFDPFFTTKSVGKGTGQGLAIARSVIVDKHGGSLAFETELGRGTCFVIRLPLVDSDRAAQPDGAAKTRPGT